MVAVLAPWGPLKKLSELNKNKQHIFKAIIYSSNNEQIDIKDLKEDSAAKQSTSKELSVKIKKMKKYLKLKQENLDDNILGRLMVNNLDTINESVIGLGRLIK